MKSFNRRNFFKIAGVAAAGAGGVALGRRKGPLPEVPGGDPWPDREERWAASVCQLCPGGCGVRARVVDGKVVKVEGNPLHPVNRGRLCPVGNAAPQLLYHPDRLRSPLRRGADGKMRPVSWEEGIGLLAERLSALRRAGEAHTAVFLAGPYHGLRERFLRRFMTAFGSKNYIRAANASPEMPDLAHVLTQGIDRPLAPDLFSARSILSFGVPLLEGGPSPAYQMRAYGHFRQGEDRPRGILIQAEARRSVTAGHADKWIAHHPGTATTLALGVAHALLLENLHDHTFVERCCTGFEDERGPGGQTRPGVHSIILREFTLPRVSAVTGVPVETLLLAARVFARHQPGVALAPVGSAGGSEPLGLRLAVHFLNALVGNLGKPGGMLLQTRPPLGEWAPPRQDDIARRSLATPRLDGAGEGLHVLASDVSENLPGRILSGRPYPTKILLAAGVDPLFDHPRAEAFSRALGRVPFVVSFSSMPDAIAQRADLVLPDAFFLERWAEDPASRFAGFSAFSLGEPVLRGKNVPLALEDTLIKTAKRIGGAVAESFDWETFADAILDAAIPLAEAERGYVAADPIKERFRAILARQGYWQPEFEDADEFWEALLKRGAWWDPGDQEEGALSQLLLPGRKFHFFPPSLEEAFTAYSGKAREKAQRVYGLRKLDGRMFPADSSSPTASAGGLQLVLFRPLALVGADAAEMPWMQEQLGPHVGARWDSWAEFHPDDARRLGLRPGDAVELRSARGRVRTQARLFGGVVPGTVAMPVGLGRPAGGRWARGRGVDPRRLVSPEADPAGGVGSYPAVRVRVRRLS